MGRVTISTMVGQNLKTSYARKGQVGVMSEGKTSMELPTYPLDEALWVGLMRGLISDVESEIKDAIKAVKDNKTTEAVDHLNNALSKLRIVSSSLNKADAYFDAVLSITKFVNTLAETLGQLTTSKD
jgi:hypothetical protein